MNRKEFIRELDNNLRDLEENERKEAIRYYEEIFDGAEESGENIEKLTEKLGSPYDIADEIKRGSGILAVIKQNKKDDFGFNNKNIKTEVTSKPNTIAIVFAIIGFPIWGGLLIAFWGVALAAVITMGALLLSLIVCAFIITVVGFVNIFTTTAVGLTFFGMGLGLYSLGFFVFKPIIIAIKWCSVGVSIVTHSFFKALFIKKTVIMEGV
ncbi:MAG: DUF1700 domain-containing protein [Oscillospiraceae bacterium]|jgi:uncharacterized membrane protein|nr:DUF1700 domain-containing protein [Oscillospiraceae bacterium]